MFLLVFARLHVVVLVILWKGLSITADIRDTIEYQRTLIRGTTYLRYSVHRFHSDQLSTVSIFDPRRLSPVPRKLRGLFFCPCTPNFCGSVLCGRRYSFADPFHPRNRSSKSPPWDSSGVEYGSQNSPVREAVAPLYQQGLAHSRSLVDEHPRNRVRALRWIPTKLPLLWMRR